MYTVEQCPEQHASTMNNMVDVEKGKDHQTTEEDHQTTEEDHQTTEEDGEATRRRVIAEGNLNLTFSSVLAGVHWKRKTFIHKGILCAIHLQVHV